MNIIGHGKIINLLNKSIVRGAISQAYLFSGPEHLGKFTVALNFAERLAGENTGVNPDLIIIKPEINDKKGIIKKSDIKIEQVRELIHKLRLRSVGEKCKLAIIDDADRLNKSAQNALLKILEEPNDKIVLILISKDDKKLLATLISRCQRIRFGLVSRGELEKNVPEDQKNRKALIFWSLGRPGLMLKMMENKKEIDSREETAMELKTLFNKNLMEKLVLAEILGKDVQKAIRSLNLWTVLLRENLLGRRVFIEDRQKCFKIIESVEKSLAWIKETNSNPRLILENLFLRF
jgi:DNA polymerase-3 subunit delta'